MVELMKAMILAAGRGKRLEPLSRVRPKPLFPVLNKPLLGVIIGQLKGIGAGEVIINAHHLAEKIEDFVYRGKWGLRVEVRREPAILGTGGGIKNCADFFKDTPFFLAVNADIYHTFDLNPVLKYHEETNNLATLVLYDYPPFNQVGVDQQGRIISIRGRELQRCTSPARILTFTGIHIISTELLAYIPHAEYFDIMKLYTELASRAEAVRGYQVRDGYWRDIGRLQDYCILHQHLLAEGARPLIHSTARVEEDVRMEGVVCVGGRTHIGRGSLIKDSILWEEIVVEEGSILEGCIVGDETKVEGKHRGEVLAPGGSYVKG